MKIHELKTQKHRGKKRIGRGGKRGTTSGRGTKGQHSRAGRRIRPASRDLIIRIPKRRGFRNKPKSDKSLTVDLAMLVRKVGPLAAGNAVVTIDKRMLHKVGILSSKFRGTIKVLGKTEVPFKMELKGIPASKGVVEAITKAGGRAINE